MKRLSVCLALAVVLAAAPAVQADYVFVAFLDGSQETPPNDSSASGFGVFILDDNLTVLSWSIAYGGLEQGDVTGAHFHQGPPGMAGGIVRGYNQADFPSPEGQVTDTWTADDPQPLTEARVNALFDGNIYFNIHTRGLPGGEIRGQLFFFYNY